MNKIKYDILSYTRKFILRSFKFELSAKKNQTQNCRAGEPENFFPAPAPAPAPYFF